MTHTPEPWTMKKCGCGDEMCDKYRINDAGMFSLADALLVISAPRLHKENKNLREVNAELLQVCKDIRDWFEGEHMIYNEELQEAITNAERMAL